MDPGAEPGTSTITTEYRYGGELGSTSVVKGFSFARHDSAVMGRFIDANDNVALVAANDNTVVAARIAA